MSKAEHKKCFGTMFPDSFHLRTDQLCSRVRIASCSSVFAALFFGNLFSVTELRDGVDRGSPSVYIWLKMQVRKRR
jgi:hypothetical protein